MKRFCGRAYIIQWYSACLAAGGLEFCPPALQQVKYKLSKQKFIIIALIPLPSKPLLIKLTKYTCSWSLCVLWKYLLWWLKTTNLFSPFWRLEIWNEVLIGPPAPSKVPGGDAYTASSSFWWSWVFHACWLCVQHLLPFWCAYFFFVFFFLVCLIWGRLPIRIVQHWGP